MAHALWNSGLETRVEAWAAGSLRRCHINGGLNAKLHKLLLGDTLGRKFLRFGIGHKETRKLITTLARPQNCPRANPIKPRTSLLYLESYDCCGAQWLVWHGLEVAQCPLPCRLSWDETRFRVQGGVLYSPRWLQGVRPQHGFRMRAAGSGLGFFWG